MNTSHVCKFDKPVEHPGGLVAVAGGGVAFAGSGAVERVMECSVCGLWKDTDSGEVMLGNSGRAERAVASGPAKPVPATGFARWTRSDDADPDSSEVLSLVRLTGESAGETFACEDMDGKRFPFLVQITSGPNVGDDFFGLFDLDGEQVTFGRVEWELVPWAEAPAEVVEQIETSWESGSLVVSRLETGR